MSRSKPFPLAPALFSSLIVVLAVAAAAAWPISAYAATQPALGTAANFGVIGSSTVTNTGPTVISSNLALDPGTSVTGFPPGTAGVQEIHNAVSLQAQSDLGIAYTDAATAPSTQDLSGTDLGGLNLTPGVYTYSSSAQLTGPITLSGNGVFIFQVGTTLTTASNASVLLTNGAQACAVWWQVGSSAILGSATQFQGNLMAHISITLTTGANIQNGRAMAQTGAVNLDTNLITPPSGTCTIPPTPTPTPTAAATSTPATTTSSAPGGPTTVTPKPPHTGAGLVSEVSGAGLLLMVLGGSTVAIARRRTSGSSTKAPPGPA